MSADLHSDQSEAPSSPARRPGPFGRWQTRMHERRPGPGRPPWNHNVAHHPAVLDAAPVPCRRALDVGCGQGHLLADLAPRCGSVLGIEPDDAARTGAIDRTRDLSNVTVTGQDVFDPELPAGGFDLVASIAVLHHLPFGAGLARMAELVAPGGTLVVVGLARPSRIGDYLRWGLGFFPANWHLWRRGHTPVDAPVADEVQTMTEVRTAAAAMDPPATVSTTWLFRYVLTWHRPR